MPANSKELLINQIAYYRRLSDNGRKRFESRLAAFLDGTRIHGVQNSVSDLDKLFVACSAVIPTFGFDKWTYYNLKDVLLYPGAFNREQFLASGYEKNTLGMIGNGPMQRVMILSKPALHAGFQYESTHNTGIHEFVHLLDKADGEVDGLPEALLKRKDNAKWMKLVDENMEKIFEGESDIDTYGASNKAEFFAVASEYFFNRPDMFAQNHADLFDFMCTIYQQNPQEPENIVAQ